MLLYRRVVVISKRNIIQQYVHHHHNKRFSTLFSSLLSSSLFVQLTVNNNKYSRNRSIHDENSNVVTTNDDINDTTKTTTTTTTTTKPRRLEEWLASIIKPSSFYIYHGGRSRTRTIKNDIPIHQQDETTSNTSHVPMDTTTKTTTTTTTATTTAQQQYQQQQRCYFYNIDLHGRLFLEEYMPKNITSSIKDDRFLYHFFTRIQLINQSHRDYMTTHNIPIHDYPYVSICQNEWNFIRPVCTPIVFHTFLEQEEEGQEQNSGGYLLYGAYGSSSGDGDGRRNTSSSSCRTTNFVLREPFNEISGLAVSKVSGKLYHILTTHSYQPVQRRSGTRTAQQQRKDVFVGNDTSLPQQVIQQQQQRQQQQYALIRSTVALSLSDRIVDFSDYQQPELSGLGFRSNSGRIVPIQYLPAYAEPGPYAMPHHIDE